MDFVEMMSLEKHGTDTYVGTGPSYPWGGLFGGQIVAQALRAAGHTVEERFHPHSLHAYYIRRGDSSEPIRYEVDRLRNGRSFVTRQVVARQSTGAILTMIASFQVEEESPEIQLLTIPTAPPPEELSDDSWSSAFERRTVTDHEDVTRSRAWIRMNSDLGDDPMLHACGLAYSSDDLPAEPVSRMYPKANPTDQLSGVSLDHAVWFHRPFRADQWRLEDIHAVELGNGRGLSRGYIFGQDGTHISSLSQEVLVRKRRS
ncbi:MAG: acyl-CoA thioesterase domain-containing protein [Acidimicrobiia bacterium]